MANSGWTADPSSFTLPPGATPPDTFLYIGDAANDPSGALTLAGLDSGIVFYFGTLPYSFVLGIFQEVGFNDGHLFLGGVDPVGPAFNRLIETDWQPISAGGAANFFEFSNSLQHISMNPSGMDMTMASSDFTLTASGDIIFGEESLTHIADTVIVDGELQVGLNEVGRGVWMSVGSTSSSAAIGTTETVVLTLPSKTYKAGRAYRVYLHAGLGSSAAGNTAFSRLLKTSLAGQVLGEFFRFNTLGTPIAPQIGFFEFVCGPADVTASLVLTLLASAGTVTQFGNATGTRTLTVEDIGNSTQITSSVVVLV